MKKLISMTSFVLEQMMRLANKEIDQNNCMLIILKYAEFLRLPLNISMFIPCKLVDGKWIVLEKPNFVGSRKSNVAYCDEYQESQSRVLFEGFELINEDKTYIYLKSKDIKIIYEKSDRLFIIETSDEFTQYASAIEDLVEYNLTLTPTAIKQTGL